MASDGHSEAEVKSLKSTSGWEGTPTPENVPFDYGWNGLPGGFRSKHGGYFANVGSNGLATVSGGVLRRAILTLLGSAVWTTMAT